MALRQVLRNKNVILNWLCDFTFCKYDKMLVSVEQEERLLNEVEMGGGFTHLGK